ncbi:hypothetical protein PG988_001113 [Apiospora saccharicola]
MVVGHAFLSEADVFTTGRHHLTKAALRITRSLGGLVKTAWRLMVMEPSRRMWKCDVDGLSVLADADSGSDMDLASLDYAEERLACSVVRGDDTIEEFQVFELNDVFEDMVDPGTNEAFRGLQWADRSGDLEKKVDQVIAADSSQRVPPKVKKRNKFYQVT